HAAGLPRIAKRCLRLPSAYDTGPFMYACIRSIVKKRPRLNIPMIQNRLSCSRLRINTALSFLYIWTGNVQNLNRCISENENHLAYESTLYLAIKKVCKYLAGCASIFSSAAEVGR